MPGARHLAELSVIGALPQCTSLSWAEPDRRWRHHRSRWGDQAWLQWGTTAVGLLSWGSTWAWRGGRLGRGGRSTTEAGEP